jgi:hypothetical protein
MGRRENGTVSVCIVSRDRSASILHGKLIARKLKAAGPHCQYELMSGSNSSLPMATPTIVRDARIATSTGA